MKTFSIITAVYNGEQYIDKCIEAVANANYDLKYVEHIVVDDGSTDKTKEICQWLAQKYKHVKFYSKPNGNWGSVINYVKHNNLVHNDYVFICDADDQILPKAFDIVNRKCKDADLFATAFYRWNGKKRKIKILPYYLMKRDLIKKYRWHYFSPLIVPQSAWTSKKIFYKSPDLKEGIPYQDVILNAHFTLMSKHIRFTSKACALYWCVRPGNSMSELRSEKGVAVLVDSLYYFSENKWINHAFYYLLGVGKVRKYLRKHKIKLDFKGAKLDFTGFPWYIWLIMWLLYLIFVRRYIKK